MKVTAIVPAAGVGRRMKKGLSAEASAKAELKKPFLILDDKPILVHTLSRLQRSHYINDIIVVVDKADLRKSRDLARNFRLNKVTKIVSGGKTRFESVWKGLISIDNKTDLVFIHDGVRPFLSPSIIHKTIKNAATFGSAVAAIPATSTIKSVSKQRRVEKSLDRDKLWEVRTPQVFRHRLLLKAYKKAQQRKSKVFDDSTLVERLGARVKIVLDSYENIKITTPWDLVIGKAILKRRGLT